MLMVRIKVNDIVLCRLKEGHIVPKNESDYDDKITLKIIGIQDHVFETATYIAYIPEYETGRIRTTLRASRFLCNEYDVNLGFAGEFMTYIRDIHVETTIWKSDGLQCLKCKDYCDKATPNQEDGKGFICYLCCQNPWR